MRSGLSPLLGRLAGCDKPDCRICTKEIAVDPDVVAAMAARMKGAPWSIVTVRTTVTRLNRGTEI